MSDRDKAGELGITEWDEAVAAAEVMPPKPAVEHVANADPVLPDYAPDTRKWFSTDRVLGWVVASAAGAVVALVAAEFLRGLC